MNRLMVVAGSGLACLLGGGALYFSHLDTPSVVGNVMMLLLLSPALYSVASGGSWWKDLSVLLGLGLFALLIEEVAILTQFPYGAFHYTDVLGVKFVNVPYLATISWAILLLGIHYVVPRGDLWGWLQRLLLLVIFDMVIDPGAVALGVWQWQREGMVAGVPLQNFAGWLLTGLLGFALLKLLLKPATRLDAGRGLLTSLMWLVAFWLGVVVVAKLYLIALVAICLLSWLLWRHARVRS